jgi:hypothetical protein
MGMFDNIFCERKLPLTKEIKKAFPNKDWAKADFQTKDLDNTMTVYYIKKNGYLYTEKVEGENVRVISEEEEKKIKNQSRWCWPYKFVESSRTSIKEEITTTVNFYDYSDDEEGNTWDIEFDAEFLKGKLISLKLAKAEIVSTAEENKAREINWQNELTAHANHPWTKTKKILNKITFNYWSTLWSNVSKILYNLQQKTQKLQIWVIRVLA